MLDLPMSATSPLVTHSRHRRARLANVEKNHPPEPNAEDWSVIDEMETIMSDCEIPTTR